MYQKWFHVKFGWYKNSQISTQCVLKSFIIRCLKMKSNQIFSFWANFHLNCRLRNLATLCSKVNKHGVRSSTPWCKQKQNKSTIFAIFAKIVPKIRWNVAEKFDYRAEKRFGEVPIHNSNENKVNFQTHY